MGGLVSTPAGLRFPARASTSAAFLKGLPQNSGASRSDVFGVRLSEGFAVGVFIFCMLCARFCRLSSHIAIIMTFCQVSSTFQIGSRRPSMTRLLPWRPHAGPCWKAILQRKLPDGPISGARNPGTWPYGLRSSSAPAASQGSRSRLGLAAIMGDLERTDCDLSSNKVAI